MYRLTNRLTQEDGESSVKKLAARYAIGFLFPVNGGCLSVGTESVSALRAIQWRQTLRD